MYGGSSPGEDTANAGSSASMAAIYIDPEAVRAELSAMTPVASVDVAAMAADCAKLDDRKFEILLYELFEQNVGRSRPGINYDAVRLMNEGVDRGRDVVLLHKQQPVAVVQCKNHGSNAGLAQVLRELVRFLLAAKRDPRLLPNPKGFSYVLALAGGATEEAVDLFHETARVVREQEPLIRQCVVEAIGKYASLRDLDAITASADVLAVLPQLSLKLLAREQLNSWLAEAKEVYSRFFVTRLVVDPDAVRPELKQLAMQVQQLRSAGDSEAAGLLQAWLNPAASITSSVVARAPGGGQAPPILLDDVYVRRALEGEVDKWLGKAVESPAEGVLVAIVAPGGSGKTSLLWHCQRKYSAGANQNAILCTAAQVSSLVDRGTFEKSLAALLDHARRLSAVGVQLVLCLDTFDVLVHREDLLAAGVSLIGGLLKSGASVVLTSRPEEMARVSLKDLAPEHVVLYLQPYNDEEFAEAVERHCHAFYRGTPVSGADVQAQINRLKNLVGLGRPVKEVCLHPLTLRMLFELYAPGVIPEDINSHRLYTAYWVARVIHDRRAGWQAPDSEARDLSAAAKALAGCMLKCGLPSLTHHQVTLLYAAGEVQESDVTELLSRNLLTRSELGSLEFFHQTFFEYAAARHLQDGAGSGLSDCFAALRQHAHDGFRLPVHEQRLLLLAQAPGLAGAELEQGVSGLLNDPHPGLLGAGLHAHMLSGAGLQCGRQFMSAAAARGDAAVLKRFCQLIYNLQPGRAAEVVQLVEVGWKPGSWQIVELLSQLFVWLAQNRWDLFRAQYERCNLTAAMYRDAPSTVHVEQVIVSMLRYGLPADADWVFDQALRCVRNHRHHPTALQFISANAGAMPLTTVNSVAARVARRVDEARSPDGIDLDPPASCLAALWDRDPSLCTWLAGDLELLDDVPGKLRLGALARVTRPEFDALKLDMLDRIEMQRAPQDLVRLLQNFLMPLIEARQGQRPWVGQAATACCADLLRRALEGQGRPWATPEVSTASIQVASSFIGDLLVKLGGGLPELDRMLAEVPCSRWLDGDGILRLLPLALSQGAPQARAAFDSVCAEPDTYPRHASIISAALRGIPCTPDRLAMAVQLAAAAMDLPLALGYVSKVEAMGASAAMAAAARTHAPTLERLAWDGSRSAKSTLRSSSFMLLASLTRCSWVAPPSHAVALAWATRDPQLSCRTSALPLLVAATRADTAGETLDALLAMAAGIGKDAINQVVDSLREVLAIPGVQLNSELTDRLVAFALREGSTEPQASIVGRITDIHCSTGNIGAANSAVLALLRSSTVRSFSATQKRKLGHHLDKPFQGLYRHATPEQLNLHVQELRDVDPYFGRLVIVPLCKCGRADVSTYVDAMIDQGDVRPELLKIMQDYRQYLWKR